MLKLLFIIGLLPLFVSAEGVLCAPKKPLPAPEGKAVELVKNGRSDAVIIIPDEGRKLVLMPIMYNPQKEYSDFFKKGINRIAAEELQGILAKATGIRMPILVGDERAAGGKPFLMLGGKDTAGIPEEGYRIRTMGNGIMITPSAVPPATGLGHDGLYAVLFGCLDFLERFCSVRFYYPGEDGTVIPKLGDLTVQPVDYIDYPSFSHRLFGGSWRRDHGGDFKVVPNFSLHKFRWRIGAHGQVGAWRDYCHRPDLFQYKGTRRETFGKKGLLPCYSDSGTVDAFMEYARLYKGTVVPFSPQDHPIRCRCEICRSKWNAEVFCGQASRIYGDFVNRIVCRMAKETPGKKLFLLPYYNYSELPSGLTIPPDTIVELCLLRSHPMWHDPAVRNYNMKLIRDWSSAVKGNKIRLWSYPMWPSLDSPLPQIFCRNLEHFIRDIHPYVSGIFLDSLINWHREFPNMYCQMKLLWNPEFDTSAALDEMCSLLYGEAAVSMRKLFSSLQAFYLSIHSGNSPDVLKTGYYQSGFVTKEHIYRKLLPEYEVAYWRSLVKNARSSVPQNSLYRRRVEFFARAMDLFFNDYSLYSNWRPAQMKIPRVSRIPGKGKEETLNWKNIPFCQFVKAYDANAPAPRYGTKIQAVCSSQKILLRMELEEPQPGRQIHKSNIWSGDCVELLFEFTPGNIYKLIIDSRGKGVDSTEGPGKFVRKSVPFWRTASCPGGWLLYVTMPFDALQPGRDYVKNPLRANFVRTRRIKGEQVEISRWQTRFVKKNSDLGSFGILQIDPVKD